MTVRRLILAVLAVSGVALATACGAPTEDQPPAHPAEHSPDTAPLALGDYDFGGDFTLTSHVGTPWALADHRGQAVLLFFGYTACPDYCPMTMSKIAKAIGLADVDPTAVHVAFVTVDIERDTQPLLANYAASFGVPMTALTGTRPQIDAVVAQYRAAYEIRPVDSAAGHEVSHTVSTYLIGRDGRLRHVFRHADPPERIAEGLRLALRS